MYKHFAKAFSIYYTRQTRGKKNYYRFINGMNSEEFAHEVGEESLFDNTRLSRIISGERLPREEQLVAICNVLDVSDDEENLLRGAVRRDIGEKYGHDLHVMTDKRVVDVLLRDIERMRAAIEDEDYQLALEYFGDWRDSQQKFLGNDTPSAPLMRVSTMAETERRKLMNAFTTSVGLGDPIPRIVGIAEAYKVADLIEGLELPEEPTEIARRYFIDNASAADIAEEEGLTLATVLSVVEVVKEKLLQLLAGAAGKDGVA